MKEKKEKKTKKKSKEEEEREEKGAEKKKEILFGGQRPVHKLFQAQGNRVDFYFIFFYLLCMTVCCYTIHVNDFYSFTLMTHYSNYFPYI